LIGTSNFGEFFFKKQVISVAFRLVRIGFPGWESDLLGTLEGAVIGIPAFFPGKQLNVTDFLTFLESGGFILLALWSRAAGDFLLAQ
jgi:hypothetical protein